jgi:hypothetical protein
VALRQARARAIDAQNRELGRVRGGVQIVGAQAACERGKRRGIHGIRKQAKRLFRQYRRAKRKRRGLALQVSFSSTPEADAQLPVERIPPALAAKCTRHALRRGAGAILFWASPESMATLFEVGRVARLRGP